MLAILATGTDHVSTGTAEVKKRLTRLHCLLWGMSVYTLRRGLENGQKYTIFCVSAPSSVPNRVTKSLILADFNEI